MVKFTTRLRRRRRGFRSSKDNLKHIEDHNSGGKHSYKLGLNKFSDLTKEEFQLGYTVANIPKRKLSNNKVTTSTPRYSLLSDDDVLPDSVDWRTKGAVAPIKNQQKCGGDYAFSAIAAVEGINQIVTGDLITLSEQQIIDCDTDDTVNNGCNGGFYTDAFTFIIKNGGIDTEEDYPFTDESDLKCKKNTKVVSIDGYADVPVNNETELKKAVANQPIAVALKLKMDDFQSYTAGIDGDCGSELSLSLVIVGYGTENSEDYWLLRNAWGTNWGDEGYIKLKRNVNEITGKCGNSRIGILPDQNQSEPIKPHRGREKRKRPLIM
ncbi:unnamed protein product [Lactuca virosa]|uniref:Peptidase C1A papain C-terminal domain-containing protein n=1 Tax=Lactuca virosa TaxID=75947 RepID=A0AAU9NXN2_9ASTR|nr:unnamed protein product [Lactuca virosa]